MPVRWFETLDLEGIAAKVGTPFFLYHAETLRERARRIRNIAPEPGVRARYAMKACSLHVVLRALREADLWIDAVSGNEVLRAKAAGFPAGAEPPVILLTSDVFRDNSLDVVLRERILPNVGSPGMLSELARSGYRGPVGFRVNPGFGHGHVEACDTGGPSSKHGIWYEDAPRWRHEAERLGLRVTLLHAHVGTGPEFEEFYRNMHRLADLFESMLDEFPDVEAVNFGGGIPYPYRPGVPEFDLAPFGELLARARARCSERTKRDIRVEIEPGRYLVAPAAVLVARVRDVKETRENEKGPGHLFTMVDAGFCDLVRPAMYGSYHHMTIPGNPNPPERTAVAGPLCESGDVFTRDLHELLEPRELPRPRPGDLLVLHDAGAYGEAMSSNYNSIGRAARVWVENGASYLAGRRESFEDLVRTECFERL
ncbi:MAG: diaminopimelate decarboxylase [Candidatus Binatia bacterium]|nr:MAG: diaminopimelate decarboxylase [Candidatus Binatia bacterium]